MTTTAADHNQAYITATNIIRPPTPTISKASALTNPDLANLALACQFILNKHQQGSEQLPSDVQLAPRQPSPLDTYNIRITIADIIKQTTVTTSQLQTLAKAYCYYRYHYDWTTWTPNHQQAHATATALTASEWNNKFAISDCLNLAKAYKQTCGLNKIAPHHTLTIANHILVNYYASNYQLPYHITPTHLSILANAYLKQTTTTPIESVHQPATTVVTDLTNDNVAANHFKQQTTKATPTTYHDLANSVQKTRKDNNTRDLQPYEIHAKESDHNTALITATNIIEDVKSGSRAIDQSDNLLNLAHAYQQRLQQSTPEPDRHQLLALTTANHIINANDDDISHHFNNYHLHNLARCYIAITTIKSNWNCYQLDQWCDKIGPPTNHCWYNHPYTITTAITLLTITTILLLTN